MANQAKRHGSGGRFCLIILLLMCILRILLDGHNEAQSSDPACGYTQPFQRTLPHQSLEHFAVPSAVLLVSSGLYHPFLFCHERLPRNRRCMNMGEHGHVPLKYILTSYEAGQPVFLLMWLLYLAENHMYSVAYQQHCTCRTIVLSK